MTPITENSIEEFAIELLEKLGYESVYGPDIAPDNEFSTSFGATSDKRESYEQVLLNNRLRKALKRINRNMPADVLEDAIKEIQRIHSPELLTNNETFHRFLTEGIPVSKRVDGEDRGDLVWLIDFKNPYNNDFLVVNQFTVVENNHPKRPDIVLFVNGIPLVVIELKNAADENASIRMAFKQIETYKALIPTLFTYNGFVVISDGLEAKAGTISSGFSRFMAWKSSDGQVEASHLVSQLETLIEGMLNKETLIDLMRHFIVFEKTKKEDPVTGIITMNTVKKMAAYHQYYAVNRAVESTLRAAGYTASSRASLSLPSRASGSEIALVSEVLEDTVSLEGSVRESPESYGLAGVKNQPVGDRKGGVVWHTQGSGKSLSMVFFTGKIVLEMDNPTVVVITDRNDLDDQLFDTFAASRQLLRQEPVQAKDRNHLKELLKVGSGGVVFTTIQKFQPDEGNVYELLSDRENIVVIADEAHRSQYGFKAKTIDERNERDEIVGKKVVYGFAKYLRDALPNATYLGFTGTPIENTDVNTPAVFGNYVDIYDIAQAVEDGATVRIYYESRLAKVNLSEEGKALVDELDKELEQEDLTDEQKNKAKWTRLEALVGSENRINQIAKDIIEHFEQRQTVFEGKGMIVTMSRRIAVDLYEAIIKLKPEWHSDELSKGAIKVVITSASSDGPEISKHHTSKEQRRMLADRMKNPNDELKLVIVCDMWLTGFDVPCLHTLYIDKPMKGHNLMQAIARVNRVYKDKPGGLIVDYLGIASDLKKALSFYADSGGKGDPTILQEQAVEMMLEKLEVVSNMYHGFNYEDYFEADTSKKLSIILAAEEHILGLEDGKKRYINEVTALSKAFAIALPHEQAMDVKDEIAFFQAVKARLVKFDSSDMDKTDEEMETTIRQVIDKALVTEPVIDVFDAAGLKKPDISILSEEFLMELKGMEHKNIAIEVLKKLLTNEIKSRAKKNLVKSKTLREMLEDAINKYHNKILTAAEVIDELIRLSKEIVEMDKEAKAMGLSDFEYAFYTAVASNDSARELMQKDKLRELAVALTETIRQNATIDWTIKESAKAKLKVSVKRLLRKYGYPPDMQMLATETVLKQAEMIANELTK
jgi:type I restriction enzyme R subunit